MTQERHAQFITGALALAFVAVLGARGMLGAIIEDGPAASRALREHGLQLGYDLDHQDALNAFRGAIERDPADIAAYRLAAATAWIELLFDQGAITVDDYLGQARANLSRPAPESSLATAFRRSIDRALTLSEERLRLHPDDPVLQRQRRLSGPRHHPAGRRTAPERRGARADRLRSGGRRAGGGVHRLRGQPCRLTAGLTGKPHGLRAGIPETVRHRP